MAEIRIYFEGHDTLRQGFREFFKEIYNQARAKRLKVSLIATNGTPVRDFEIALRKHRDAWNILLLDSDRPDDGLLTSTLIDRQGWGQSETDSVFWMVQMMEAWFHADKEQLKAYYGDRFNSGSMSGNPHVEQISKQDLEEGLKAATKNTTKGAYHKTKHAPDLLKVISPDRVRRASPNCNRLFDVVLARVG